MVFWGSVECLSSSVPSFFLCCTSNILSSFWGGPWYSDEFTFNMIVIILSDGTISDNSYQMTQWEIHVCRFPCQILLVHVTVHHRVEDMHSISSSSLLSLSSEVETLSLEDSSNLRLVFHWFKWSPTIPQGERGGLGVTGRQLDAGVHGGNKVYRDNCLYLNISCWNSDMHI